MNDTLFYFGFKKQVETISGKFFDVSAGLSKEVELQGVETAKSKS